MGSNTHQNFPQPNSALLRFRSAPSSLFSNFSVGIDSAHVKGSNHFEGSESVSRFTNQSANNDSQSSPGFHEFENKSSMAVMNFPTEYSGRPPHYPRPNSTLSSSSSSSSSSSVSSSHGFLGAGLARQSSSPAGVFSHLSLNGYGTMRGNNNGEVSPSSNRLNSQLNFPSILPSSMGMLSQISEVDNETIDRKIGNSDGETQFFSPSSFGPFTSWNESSQFSETFAGMKRDPDTNRKLFSSDQNGETGNRVHRLSHHLSLPKNSSDIASIEKLMQFQDAVPCRIRAKRGCATHPRSIAERVRRTRISERMRKLQELVPNMDKQTNTADMLDLAVEYIKDLQNQFKTLNDNRANCKCSSMQKRVSNEII